MIGAGMTVPNNVLRFEALLYLSLLLDALTAAFFGIAPDTATAPASPAANLFTALFIASLVLLVWLAARRRKNWACWTVFGFFALSVVLYMASLSEMAFGVKTVFEIFSIVFSAAGFYFAFRPDARRWFTT
jgi:uncharacterized membrane protein HdeD (DUF308 family)